METFTNARELNKFMQKKIELLVDLLADDFIEILKSHINTDTYGISAYEKGKPAINYIYEYNKNNETVNKGTPTYEFRDIAWDKEVKKQVSGYISKVFYNYENLTPPSKNRPYTHGSYYVWGDFREHLPEVLNNDLPQGSLFSAKDREPFWDNSVNEFANKFNNLVLKHCKKLGLELSRR